MIFSHGTLGIWKLIGSKMQAPSLVSSKHQVYIYIYLYINLKVYIIPYTHWCGKKKLIHVWHTPKWRIKSTPSGTSNPLSAPFEAFQTQSPWSAEACFEDPVAPQPSPSPMDVPNIVFNSTLFSPRYRLQARNSIPSRKSNQLRVWNWCFHLQTWHGNLIISPPEIARKEWRRLWNMKHETLRQKAMEINV